MSDVVPLFISVLALLGTFYQLHLQRAHNEKSLKPLPQIDMLDKGGVLHVRVQNNGVGPLIVGKLTFSIEKQSFSRIQDCLTASPKSYDHIDIDEANKKVIFPGAFLEVFNKQSSDQQTHADIRLFRQELSKMQLKVEGRDIYNNQITISKNLSWFNRHIENETKATL